MMMAAIIIFGIISYGKIGVGQLPDVDFPVVSATVTWEGAAPEVMETDVVDIIEDSVMSIQGIREVSSTIRQGTASITVEFDLGKNIDVAMQDVQSKIDQAQRRLPTDIDPPIIMKVNPEDHPIMWIMVYSSERPLRDMMAYIQDHLKDRFTTINGVGEIFLGGFLDRNLRIWLDRDKLAAYQLTVQDITNAVKEEHQEIPAGRIETNDKEFNLRVMGEALSPEEFGNILIPMRGSQPIYKPLYLKDVATIEDGLADVRRISRTMGRQTVGLGIRKQRGANEIEVAHKVLKRIEEIKKDLPKDISIDIGFNRTQFSEESINELVFTLILSAIVTSLVCWLFLGSWSATLNILLAIPVSVLGTFTVVYFMGFTLNTFTVLGLSLAIGIVVDDAIVVVEAVMHHIEQGLLPKEATIKAMSEVTSPVIAIALILAAVFIPVAFMGGITGSLYQQFAVTIAISVLFSAFNALTLSPALAALLLKPKGGKKSPLDKFYVWFNKRFGSFTNGYMSLTGILVRKTIRSVSFIGVIIVLLLVLFKAVPSGFVPEEDNGYFMASVILPDASSIQRSDEVCKKVEKIFSETKTIDNYTTVVGYNFISGVTGSNVGGFFIAMKPWSERKGEGESSFETIEMLNKRLAEEIPEAVAFVFGPPAIQGLGSGSGFSFMLQDKSGNTPEELFIMTQKFMAAAKQRPEIGSITSFYRSNVPQIYADINLDKVMKQGIDISSVNQTLGTFLGSSYINDFNKFGRVYRVYLSSEGEYRDALNDFGQFFVKNNKGEMVPLSSIVSIKNVTGPDFTNRFNLYRSAQLTGTPGAGYSSGECLNALKEVAAEVLPTGWGYDWSDMSYQEEKASGTGATVFVLALVLVFLILAAQYESWSLPMSVLLGTPFAIFGAMLGLWISRLFSESFVNNIYAQIGFVTLIGLSAKNAILIVEFAKEKREKGEPIIQSALEAAQLRLRPILMTSFAFILGVVPLVRASGAGAEARKVMGMAVFAGLLVATSLAIFLIPALFVMVEKYFVREKKSETNHDVFSPPPEIAEKKGDE